MPFFLQSMTERRAECSAISTKEAAHCCSKVFLQPKEVMFGKIGQSFRVAMRFGS